METSDKEVLDLKSQLAAIEEMPSFGKNGFKHNLAKRQADEEEQEGVDQEEGRGWKNKEKKRKNKKEKKRRKKFEINLPQEETSVKKDSEVDSGETEESDVGAEASFTSGLQFSAYSPHQGQASTYGKKPESGSSYKDQGPPQRADQILYGLDSQGSPVYMDAADVAELLGTPKAKKVRGTRLRST